MLTKILEKIFHRKNSNIEETIPMITESEYPSIKYDKILFQGEYIDKKPIPVIITQTNEEFELLKKGILLAQIYTPLNDWITPIIGTYSDNHIDAYSIGTGYGTSAGIPVNLKERIIIKELELADTTITSTLREFSDVIDFLKREPKNSYHLTRSEDGSWKGKEIYYGFAMVNGPKNVGAKEKEMKLNQ